MKFWIILGIVFASSTTLAQVEGATLKRTAGSLDIPCDEYEHPKNGVRVCSYSGVLGGHSCSVMCNDGFQFERKPAAFYICQPDGNWFVWHFDTDVDLSMPWPDCIESTPSPPAAY